MHDDVVSQRSVTELARLATRLHAAAKWQEAIECYQQLLLLDPSLAAVHSNLGIAYKASGNLDAAIASYRQAIALQPDLADAYSNLANALCVKGELEEAAGQCRQAIRLNPDFAEAHNNLGNILRGMRRYGEALQSYQRAVQLKPDYVEARANAGHLFKEAGQIPQAIACYEQTLQLQADYPEAYGNLSYLHMERCDWRDYDARRAAILAAIARGQKGYGTLQLLALSDSASLQQRCAQLHAAHNHPAMPTPLHDGKPYHHKKIRLAYLSADFRDHAVSYLIGSMFALHDRDRFEVIGLALATDPRSRLGQRVRQGFDQFIDVSAQSDRETAQLIRAQEIDILVDLMGYTKGCRPNILAQRPAPVQVSYLGFPATMGTDYIDYIIADHYLIPAAQQQYYSEQVAYVDGCFQVNDAQRFRPTHTPQRESYGLPATGFVFCCFNNSYKITPALFDCWMRILAKVPGSVLWLIANDDNVRDSLRREAAQRNIAPSRLVFAERLPYEEYLTRFQLADLFLDTFPFNAGTTASDALWCGVPVLTRSGEAVASRMAGSLLTAIGLPELITTEVAAYEALAWELAMNPALLNRYRERLQVNRFTGTVFDTAAFCRQLEAALVAMMEPGPDKV